MSIFSVVDAPKHLVDDLDRTHETSVEGKVDEIASRKRKEREEEEQSPIKRSSGKRVTFKEGIEFQQIPTEEIERSSFWRKASRVIAANHYSDIFQSDPICEYVEHLGLVGDPETGRARGLTILENAHVRRIIRRLQLVSGEYPGLVVIDFFKSIFSKFLTPPIDLSKEEEILSGIRRPSSVYASIDADRVDLFFERTSMAPSEELRGIFYKRSAEQTREEFFHEYLENLYMMCRQILEQNPQSEGIYEALLEGIRGATSDEVGYAEGDILRFGSYIDFLEILLGTVQTISPVLRLKNLTMLPIEILFLPEISELYLENIEQVPPPLALLPLEKISVSSSNCVNSENWKFFIERSRRLKEIRIHNIRIDPKFFPQLCDLEDLTRVEISRCALKTLPPIFFLFPATLEELCLDDNELNALPSYSGISKEHPFLQMKPPISFCKRLSLKGNPIDPTQERLEHQSIRFPVLETLRISPELRMTPQELEKQLGVERGSIQIEIEG